MRRWWSWFLLHFGLERGEGLRPEAIAELPQGFESFGVELVEPPGAGRDVAHQLRLFEDAQMLGDRRPADGKLTGDVHDRLRTAQKRGEDGPTGGIAECIQLHILVGLLA